MVLNQLFQLLEKVEQNLIPLFTLKVSFSVNNYLYFAQLFLNIDF
jgi:hypothetical protein